MTLTSCVYIQGIILDTKCIILLLPIKTKSQIYIFQGNQKNWTPYNSKRRSTQNRIFELIKNYNKKALTFVKLKVIWVNTKGHISQYFILANKFSWDYFSSY